MKLPIVLFGLVALGGAAMCGSGAALLLAAPPVPPPALSLVAPVQTIPPRGGADGWPFVPLLGMGAVAVLAVAGWARRASAVVYIGAVPVQERQLDTAHGRALQAAAVIAQAQAAILAAARTSEYPALTHGTWHEGHGGTVPATAAPLALPAAPAGGVPTFAAMLDRGLVQPGDRLVIGYKEDGTPRWGSWLDLYNLLMLGLSGFGKSTAARYLACWHVLNGGKLILVDPHGKSGDESLLATLAELHGAFLCDPATDAPSAVKSFRLADSVMRGRLEGRSQDTWPLLVIVDELPEVMTYSGWAEAAPLAAEYLSVGNKSGRKKRCYTLATSQLGTVDQLGGGAVQQSFVAVAAFRSKRRQAQLLDFEREDKATIQRLPVGSALVMLAQATEPEQLYFPNTTPEDGARVAGMLATARPTPGYFAANSAPVAAPVTMMDVAKVAGTGETHEALSRFLAGQSVAEIVAGLRGVRSNQGATYQKNADDVQELIRAAIRGKDS